MSVFNALFRVPFEIQGSTKGDPRAVGFPGVFQMFVFKGPFRVPFEIKGSFKSLFSMLCLGFH